MALAGIVIALLAASEVSVAVVPGAPCVDRSSLVLRLQSAGLRVVPGTSARLAVTIRLEGEGLSVRAAAFDRSVPVRAGECGAVERVVVALITSWSLQLPSLEAEPKRANSQAVAPMVTAKPDALPLVPEPPREELTPPPAAPPADRKPLLSGAPVREIATSPVSAPVAPGPFALDVAALGGGSLGPTPALAGVGQLHAGLSYRQWGVLLEGGFQSARADEVGGVRVESTTQWLSISGRVRFQPISPLRLDVALGFRLWRITAQSFNAVNPQSIELLGLGGVLSVGGSLRLVGPASLHLRAFTSLRSSRPRFVVDGLGPILELQPWEGGLLLGLEFHLFG